MLYVVGSGPAGVSCAKALLARGEEVTMLDAGLTLEPGKAKRLEYIQEAPPEHWDNPDTRAGQLVQEMKMEMMETVDGIGVPQKLAYGSDYPYQHLSGFGSITWKNTGLKHSFAKGGFSTVWGAQILPFRQEDMANWPITVDDLAPHYRAVLDFIPITAERDGLHRYFPLYTDTVQDLQRSTQITRFLHDLEEHRDVLHEDGIYFGCSRLAFHAEPSDGKPGCAYSGLCMYGSPYGLVYNAAETVDDLKNHSRFTYRSGIVVKTVEESGRQVTLHGTRKGTEEAEQFTGEKAFLGCGVTGSTKIVLSSKNQYNTPVTAASSPYFFIPLVRPRGGGDVVEEDAIGLAEAYLEIINEDISPYTVHLEVSGYNDIYRETARHVLGPIYSVIEPVLKPVYSRVFLLQGFLHSHHSNGVTMTLHENEGGEELVVEGGNAAQEKLVVRRVARKLREHITELGAVPLPAITHEPGSSFHVGGTLPMQNNPEALESDVLGRPTGFERVHVVDATVLPTVPATTVTLPVMANAHRIGANHDKEVGQ